jgi:Cu2+-exporting ATPase
MWEKASFIDADQRHFLRWISLVMSIPVMLYAAQPFFVGAWRNLRHRNLGMDVPGRTGTLAGMDRIDHCDDF